jgi:hypothetical protein
LSVQMTDAHPSVSTAGSLRTSACRFAMRCTPMARAMVTTAASPSGTAAMASATAERSTSNSGAPRHSCTAATTATMPTQP